MLTAEQIRDKIFRSAEEFKRYVREKKWSNAKYVYDRASAMAVFMELPETDMMRLFGSGPYVEDTQTPEDGLFRAEEVEKAYLECIKSSQTYEIKPYPGIPTIASDYGADVWSKQDGSGAAHSPYEIYGNGA